MWMACEKFNNALYARLDAIGALRRMLGNVVEDQAEIGKCRGRVANLHRPCLAQTERTCSSEANSPRAAAALELAMAWRSSSDSGRAARRRCPQVPGQCVRCRPARPAEGRARPQAP